MNHKSNIVILDNYDSFTYNLVQYIEECVGYTIDVFKNDEITVGQLIDYEYIFISPGPGLPEESGIILNVIDTYLGTKKIFGVCLGLQSIVVALGGQLKNLKKVYHGIESEMYVQNIDSPIFENIDKKFTAGRYHSWVAEEENFPEELTITCRDSDNQIMAIQHKKYPVYAVQFHPESIMTESGKKIIANFLNL